VVENTAGELGYHNGEVGILGIIRSVAVLFLQVLVALGEQCRNVNICLIHSKIMLYQNKLKLYLLLNEILYLKISLILRKGR